MGFYDNPNAVMCNSVFAEDENAEAMVSYQLSTMREHVTTHTTGGPP
jgi:hypothetical protein